MESSRDSSVWRSLAVTFGGGLALGAVTMKLTQTALRPAEATRRPEPDAVTDRLKVVERRLEKRPEKLEHPPVPPRPAAATPAPAAVMDQRVLEAVIGAVDARLHEHAGQMDRRLADLEARMAVAQGLQQQDRETAEQLRQDAAALRQAMELELRQVRESVSLAAAGQTATRTDFEMFSRLHQQQLADLRQEYRQEVAQLRGEVERSIETRIVTSAAAAVAAQLEEQLAPLRAEVRQKEQELAELRRRLADSEKSALDVVSAIGDVCRQAADRIGASRPDRLGGSLEEKPAAPPPTLVAPQPETSSGVEEPAPMAPPSSAETSPPAPPVPEIPPFLRETKQVMSWRVPLVSSFLFSTGYLVLMHYLSVSLQ
jgi:hypothetical protein